MKKKKFEFFQDQQENGFDNYHQKSDLFFINIFIDISINILEYLEH
jgi:hypothetical protein